MAQSRIAPIPHSAYLSTRNMVKKWDIRNRQFYYFRIIHLEILGAEWVL
jgi:hypothetical protein